MNIYKGIRTYYRKIREAGDAMMEEKPQEIIVKRRGDDEYRVISVRLPAHTLARIDALAEEANFSRNELIVKVLTQGIEILKIED